MKYLFLFLSFCFLSADYYGDRLEEAINLRDYKTIDNILYERKIMVDLPLPMSRQTPLILAVQKGDYDVLEYLLKYNPRINKHFSSDPTKPRNALDWAYFLGQFDIVNLLQDHGGKLSPGYEEHATEYDQSQKGLVNLSRLAVCPNGHIFHKKCLADWLNVSGTLQSCPLCRVGISRENLTKPSYSQYFNSEPNCMICYGELSKRPEGIN